MSSTTYYTIIKNKAPIKTFEKYASIDYSALNKNLRSYRLYITGDDAYPRNNKYGEIYKKLIELESLTKGFGSLYNSFNNINSSGVWTNVYPAYANDEFDRCLFLVDNFDITYIFINISNDDSECYKELSDIFVINPDTQCVHTDKFDKIIISDNSDLSNTSTRKNKYYYHIKSEDNIKDALEDLIKSFGIDNITLDSDMITINKSIISTYISKLEENDKLSIKSKVEDNERSMHTYLTNYNNAYEKYLAACKDLENYTSKGRFKLINDVLTKYLEKGIILEIRTNSYDNIELLIESEIFNYDENIAEKMLKHLQDATALTVEQFIKYIILENMFVNPKYTIITKTPICFNKFRSMNVSRYCDRSLDILRNLEILDKYNVNHNIYDAIPNPHIAYHDCWGTNGPQIIKLLKTETRVEDAFQALLASLGNLNLNDTIVFNEFMNIMIGYYNTDNKYYDENKFIKDLETGELINVKEFVKRCTKK